MLKAEIGSKKLPVFKYYKNVDAADKSSKAYELMLPSDADLSSPKGISKVSEVLIEEMKGGLDHSVMDIGDSMMSELARVATDLDDKVFVMYCYNDDNGIDYTLRAISHDPLIKDDYKIVAIYKPSEKTL